MDLLQPITQKQQSYIKDTTDFINFVENTKIGALQDTILVAMDVSSLYTSVPQEEGTEIVCKANETFYNNDPPIPTRHVREMLGVILTENSKPMVSNGHKNSRVFCKYIHGGDRNKSNSTKQYQAKRMETLQ